VDASRQLDLFAQVTHAELALPSQPSAAHVADVPVVPTSHGAHHLDTVALDLLAGTAATAYANRLLELARKCRREERTPLPRVEVQLHRNRRTMVSYRREGDTVRLRVHEAFLRAPEPVQQAVVDFMLRRRTDFSETLREFIRTIVTPEGTTARRPKALRATGRVHDLARLYDEQNAAHFDGAVTARIGWSVRRIPKRHIRLGAYFSGDDTILINPILDDPNVPELVIRFIVFHEMLHAALGIEEVEGRRISHSKAFRALEARHPDYGAAMTWEQSALGKLMRAVRGRGQRA